MTETDLVSLSFEALTHFCTILIRSMSKF